MERETMEEALASAGTFCPNEECQFYAKVDEGKIIKYGRSKQGVTDVRAAKPPSPPRAARSFIVSTLL
jgi:hypothetical protein